MKKALKTLFQGKKNTTVKKKHKKHLFFKNTLYEDWNLKIPFHQTINTAY